MAQRRLENQPQFRLLKTVTSDETYCFAKARPVGAYVPVYRMAKGQSIAADYPEDPFSVELALDPDWPGLKLPSIIGNAGRLVVVHRDVVSFLQKGFSAEPFETFSFTLTNHKGRVHSKDYVFFNPLALHACLHGREANPTALNERLILDRQQLLNAGDVFRVQQAPNNVLFSEKLAEALLTKGFTNFEFADVLYSDQ